MPQGATPKHGEKTGKMSCGLLDLDLDDVIELVINSDDCHDDDFMEAQREIFNSGHEVFVVRGLSKAISGFRPAVTCEGFLASVSRTSSGYTLLPRGADQHLSFKYEPPSPKFSCRQPSSISYRLQLLHGSQCLYSLRGLSKILRCQRSAHALEWGPVHLVFAAAADLDTFLATLKYVDVVEMAPVVETQQSTIAAAVATAGRSTTICGCSSSRQSSHAMQRKDGHRGHGSNYAHGCGSSCVCPSHIGAPFFAATGGPAVLAAVAAACLLTQRGAGPASGRKRVAESPANVPTKGGA
ncbi:hypothetical protein Vretimale_19362 [Volvox reticuliferus]|uniref:Uncharacterized protein n=1 Tax=Volvox reticuliferus TaxID=1737510 RepID=A0A8J4D6R3_9CHLO|nr:hypothetical protein Vretifemale_20595 [Volvox reticuliferus]GIM16772.1 hypothetical protein Vretimale_19362 [Volvox reticuliferus]